jgi:GNAT superfamily N-acetyltransferase
MLKIYTGSELYDHLVNYDLINPWAELERLENSFRFFGDLINHDHNACNYFFCIIVDGDIIGLTKFKVGGSFSCYNPEYNNWISYVCVDKHHKSKGYSKIMLEGLFKFAKERNLSILSSGYTSEGYLRIRPRMHKLAKEFGIDFKDADKVEF